MKNIEEASVEAGSEEIGKPIVKGFITGVFAVIVEWAEKHEHAIVVFTVIAGVISFPVYQHFKNKRAQKKKEHDKGHHSHARNAVHHKF